MRTEDGYEPPYKLTAQDNGSTTRYLLVKTTGAYVVSVDEAIDDHESGQIDTNGVYLLTRGGYAISAHIEDVNPAWDRYQRKQRGWHFQISEFRESGDEPLLEEVIYVDTDRDRRERRIVLVDGWDHEISPDE